MSDVQGTFIVLSGGEGSGKSSVLSDVQKTFPDFLYTSEPGGTPVGKRIRSVLLDDRLLQPDVLTELFLFFADRAEHVRTVIEPALAKGKSVLSDRYWMDTFAYQWYATMERTDSDAFLRLFQDFHFPVPGLWLWLDVDPAEGLRRRKLDGKMDRFDEKALAFHTRVHDGFQLLLDKQLFPSVRIDANLPFDQVKADVESHIRGMMKTV